MIGAAILTNLATHPRPLRLVVAAGLSVVGLTAALALQPATPLLLINETTSLPRGVYARQTGAPVRRGATVALPQPERARPYLRRLGAPTDMALLKRVAAVGGDHVCADGRRLIAPFRTVAVRSADRAGRPLPAWRGCRSLASDELLLLGDTADSFDSRYFGPVREDEVLGVYEEVLSW